MALYRRFPRYVDFTDFTPVIPEIYWNVYSSEQRIRALCCEWVKLVAYVDGMADTVNDQYKIIEDMEKRLPELVNADVIAEIQRLVNSGEFKQFIEQAIADFEQEIRGDITALQNADTALGNRIDGEASTRANADTALGNRITEETSSRAAADTALGNRITAEQTARENADAQLSSRISAIENAAPEVVEVFGDSYLLGTHSDSATTGNTGYDDFLTDILPSNWTINYHGYGGCGIWRAGSNGNRFSQNVVAVKNTQSEAYRNSVSKVLVQSGYNDGNHFDEMNAALVTNLISTIKTHYPNAKVYIIYTYGAGRPIPVNQCKTYNIYQNKAIEAGASFASSININFALTTPSYDNIHPTAQQQRYIAGLIATFLYDSWTGDYIVGETNYNTEYNVMIDGKYDAHVSIQRTLTSAVNNSTVPYLIGTSNARPALSIFTPSAVTSAPWGIPVLRFNNQGQCHIMHVDAEVPAGQKVYGAFTYNIVNF